MQHFNEWSVWMSKLSVSEQLLEWAKIWWCIFLTLNFAEPLTNRHHRHYLRSVFRKVTYKLLCESLILILVTITAGITLYFLISPLRWTWLWLLPGNSQSTDSAPRNIIMFPVSIRHFGLFFTLLILVNVPAVARLEERKFRLGTKDWADGFRRSVCFGLVHCIVGVPIAFGVALTITGLWYTHHYFLGGLKRSILIHTCYNTILLTTAFALLIVAELLRHT